MKSVELTLKFDTHQLEKRNTIARIGDFVGTYSPDFRKGFSHYFEIVEIVDETEYKVRPFKGFEKATIDTIVERDMRGGPTLYYWEKPNFGLEECYYPKFVALTRKITVID